MPWKNRRELVRCGGGGCGTGKKRGKRERRERLILCAVYAVCALCPVCCVPCAVFCVRCTLANINVAFSLFLSIGGGFRCFSYLVLSLRLCSSAFLHCVRRREGREENRVLLPFVLCAVCCTLCAVCCVCLVLHAVCGVLCAVCCVLCVACTTY